MSNVIDEIASVKKRVANLERIETSSYGLAKTIIESGATLTIPNNFCLVVSNKFTVAGTLTISGNGVLTIVG